MGVGVRFPAAAAAIALGLGCFATSASADGYGAPGAPAAAPFSWTGFYFGANFGAFDSNSHNVDNFFNPSAHGDAIGAQAGYNLQFQHLVVGVEVDANWVDASGSKLCANPSFSCQLGVDDQESIRGRLGFAWNRVLLYGTAGWARADVNGQTVILATGASFPSGELQRNGPIFGGGIDVAVTKEIILGFQYLHADFGTATALYDTTYRVPLTTDTLRGQVSVKF